MTLITLASNPSVVLFNLPTNMVVKEVAMGNMGTVKSLYTFFFKSLNFYIGSGNLQPFKFNLGCQHAIIKQSFMELNSSFFII